MRNAYPNSLKDGCSGYVVRHSAIVELPLEQVPSLKKQMTRQARCTGKPVFVAPMLESIMQPPVPTRAEVSDVATAVYEGADRRQNRVLSLGALEIPETTASELRRNPFSRQIRLG
jgi:hypothetical protein